MKYHLDLSEDENGTAEIDATGFFSKPTLFHNGKLLWEASSGTNIYNAKSDRGEKTTVIEMEDSFFDESPQVKVNGRSVSLETPSPLWVKVLAHFPLLLSVFWALFGDTSIIVVLLLTLPFAALSIRALRLKQGSIIKVLLIGFSFISSFFIGLAVVLSITGLLTITYGNT